MEKDFIRIKVLAEDMFGFEIPESFLTREPIAVLSYSASTCYVSGGMQCIESPILRSSESIGLVAWAIQ